MRDVAFRILKTTLALGAMTYLVVLVEPSAIAAALTDARWPWIATAVALLPVNLMLDGIVWRRLLAPVAPKTTPRQLSGAILSGFALGFITPARAGEFVGRALYLPDADPWTVSLTIFVQRLIDTTINVAAGVVVLAAALYLGVIAPSWPWIALLAGSGLFLVLLIGFLAAPATAARWVRTLSPNRPALHRRVDVLQAYRPYAMVRASGGAIVRYGVFCLQFGLLIYAFTPPLTWGQVLSAVVLTFFVKFIVPSITVMDLGIQEGAAVFFLSLFGASQAVAFNAALLLFIINIVVPTLVGVPFVWNLNLDRARTTAPSTSPTAAD